MKAEECSRYKETSSYTGPVFPEKAIITCSEESVEIVNEKNGKLAMLWDKAGITIYPDGLDRLEENK